MTNCWIQRRHAQKGYGGTIEPERFTVPDYHFTSMAALAERPCGKPDGTNLSPSPESRSKTSIPTKQTERGIT